MSQPIYLSADIRSIEAAARDSMPPLMQRAGLAAAGLARRLAGGDGQDILVLAGPGNNGGDAFEAAVHLREARFRVHLVCPSGTARLPADAAAAAARWQAAGGEVLAAIPQGPRWSLAIDGLFGIGLRRAPEAPYAGLISAFNALACPRLALDIPSGLDSDSGRVQGIAVRATHTLSFIACKPGLLTLEGPDHCGVLEVADLGLAVKTLLPPGGWICSPQLFSAALKPRARNFHKGLSGSVGVLGGDDGMCGAVLLAARAAARLGAGRVYTGLLDRHAPRYDPVAPELMLRAPDALLGLDLDALVIGPGMGNSERAEALLIAGLSEDIPVVLDADALNLVAANPDLAGVCLARAARNAETLITPHPAEAARLLACATAEVQDDRLSAARRLRDKLGAHVVLKGAGSVLAARDGHWFINTTGNPGLSSAGTGDVLAGMLGALLGQGLSAESSMVLGVHLHGAAADALAAQGDGPVGILAGELPLAARRLWNAWLQSAA